MISIKSVLSATNNSMPQSNILIDSFTSSAYCAYSVGKFIALFIYGAFLFQAGLLFYCSISSLAVLTYEHHFHPFGPLKAFFKHASHVVDKTFGISGQASQLTMAEVRLAVSTFVMVLMLWSFLYFFERAMMCTGVLVCIAIELIRRRVIHGGDTQETSKASENSESINHREETDDTSEKKLKENTEESENPTSSHLSDEVDVGSDDKLKDDTEVIDDQKPVDTINSGDQNCSESDDKLKDENKASENLTFFDGGEGADSPSDDKLKDETDVAEDQKSVRSIDSGDETDTQSDKLTDTPKASVDPNSIRSDDEADDKSGNRFGDVNGLEAELLALLSEAREGKEREEK